MRFDESSVSTTKLTQDSESGMGMLMIVRQRLQVFPKSGHDLVDDRLDDWVEVFSVQVVNTKFQSTQTLRNQFSWGLQSKHQRSHQMLQMRNQNRQSDRNILESTTTDTSEEQSDQMEVRTWFLGSRGVFQRVQHHTVQMWQDDTFILLWEKIERHETELEETNDNVASGDIGRAQFRKLLHKESDQHTEEVGCDFIVGDEKLRNVQKHRIL
ncbi:hypothetical protein WICPIJ_001945 [Wickerhamomyces pijperi]|uniref:Uncharacterized protein n=1 Tax=Wickerhamomyces pijperi TaxID=599730 RepID=A0A9P8QCK0_WICPI|nr:hypothetical protein WICPIJ_001945 [Wickerhamomyces pijperi]